ncbi:hypothetical protein M1P56_31685 [Streptomyces sp. HU2014]|uniref:hypothetical protein n=1 Tax=Streptomyces sp. HU2014 TaxID=2939414 RepID=UPI00200BEB89|nr:hypothetical protein [Streptomyces sp. HU2014]UQI48555.1 hypothetical protein M1P56_31685 [Streptomyces sp. HU2014]
MSLGDDGYGGNGQDSGRSGGDYRDYGDRHLTRTRLPEGEGDPYAPARRGGRGGRGGGRTGLSSRNLVTVVGVVVLLIAAIAFANRGGGDSASDESEKDGGRTASAQPTGPTGTKPVGGKTAGIASGFAHTEQGAQSAAANFAVALGGDGMFRKDTRREIVDVVYAPDVAAARRGDLDKVYSDQEFLKKIGLDADGNAPKGMTFVSRTNPVGTKLVKYEGDTASVAVWYSSLFGLAGERSTNPVAESWFTNTFELKWSDDWKVTGFTQKDGPAPVGRDQAAATAKDMSEAVQGFGGFTYAR